MTTPSSTPTPKTFIASVDHLFERVEALTPSTAAETYVRRGDWHTDASTSTTWVDVSVYEEDPTSETYVRLLDGTEAPITEQGTTHTIALHPDEPPCPDEAGHHWSTRHEDVGGLKENPGVWGSGGGVIMFALCRNCGMQRAHDTWATNPTTGQQGLTSMTYRTALA